MGMPGKWDHQEINSLAQCKTEAVISSRFWLVSAPMALPFPRDVATKGNQKTLACLTPGCNFDDSKDNAQVNADLKLHFLCKV